MLKTEMTNLDFADARGSQRLAARRESSRDQPLSVE
jgi:hypothetical protein